MVYSAKHRDYLIVTMFRS